MRKKYIKKSVQNGFSLVEVLVSMVLISVGLLGALGMIKMAQKNMQSSFNYTQANILGANLMENMRANRNALQTNPTLYSTVPTTCQTNVEFDAPTEDLRRFVCNIRASLQNPQTTVTFNDGLATITIVWTDSLRSSADSNVVQNEPTDDKQTLILESVL